MPLSPSSTLNEFPQTTDDPRYDEGFVQIAGDYGVFVHTPEHADGEERTAIRHLGVSRYKHVDSGEIVLCIHGTGNIHREFSDNLHGLNVGGVPRLVIDGMHLRSLSKLVTENDGAHVYVPAHLR